MTERVLMIEDDKALAAMVSEYLSKQGIEVASKPQRQRGPETHPSGWLRCSRFRRHASRSGRF